MQALHNQSVWDLRHRQLCDEGVAEVARAITCLVGKHGPHVRSNPRTLLLDDNSIWAGGMSILCEALANSNVVHLSLTNNEIGDEGVQELAGLLRRSDCTIEKLSLYNCDVTNRGCNMLLSALQENYCIQSVEMGFNCISDQDALAKIARLCQANVAGRSKSQKGTSPCSPDKSQRLKTELQRLKMLLHQHKSSKGLTDRPSAIRVHDVCLIKQRVKDIKARLKAERESSADNHCRPSPTPAQRKRVQVLEYGIEDLRRQLRRKTNEASRARTDSNQKAINDLQVKLDAMTEKLQEALASTETPQSKLATSVPPIPPSNLPPSPEGSQPAVTASVPLDLTTFRLVPQRPGFLKRYSSSTSVGGDAVDTVDLYDVQSIASSAPLISVDSDSAVDVADLYDVRSVNSSLCDPDAGSEHSDVTSCHDIVELYDVTSVTSSVCDLDLDEHTRRATTDNASVENLDCDSDDDWVLE